MQKIIEKLIPKNAGIIWGVVALAISCLVFTPPKEVTPLIGMAFGILGTLAKRGGE